MPKGRPKKVAASAGAAQPAKASKTNGNGANLGFEARLFLAAQSAEMFAGKHFFKKRMDERNLAGRPFNEEARRL